MLTMVPVPSDAYPTWYAEGVICSELDASLGSVTCNSDHWEIYLSIYVSIYRYIYIYISISIYIYLLIVGLSCL